MKRTPRAARPGAMEPGRTHLPVESKRQRVFNELVVVPDVMTAMERAAEKALLYSTALAALSADNECAEHGCVPGDSPEYRAERGCTCHGGAPKKKSAPVNGRAIDNFRGPDGAMQKILCACGRTWTRRAVRGRVPKCPDCRGETTTNTLTMKESS